MTDKIAAFLSVVCVVLVLVLSYTFSRINTLKDEKKALKNEICKKEQIIKEKDQIIKEKEQIIKEMEKINELYQKAEKENEDFRQQLVGDNSDNLDVVPADYILNRLHKD